MRFKVPFSDKKEFLKLSFKLRNFPDDEIKALKDKTVMEFIEEHTSSKVSKNIFIIASDCYAVYDHHYVGAQDYVELSKKSFRGKGVSYPIGGCSAIPKAYSEILEATGNTIMTNQAVEKILLEGNKAIGVVLANGNQVMAEKIISNVNWKVMHGTLLSKDAFPTALGGKIENLKHSHSSLVAHIALKKPLIKKKFVMRASDFTNEDAHQMRLKGEKVTDVGGFIPIVSNIDPNLAPPGKQLVCIGLDGRFEFDYDKNVFEELALSFVQELAEKKVNIRNYVEWIHILLPKDLEALFGEKGSVIGLAQILGQVRDNRIECKTPIEHLYHCGDDSGTGLFGVGTELAALSGQHCAKLILTDERIL
ncbi:MAG: NAD(P)/FAD-dependent oxidoreductase [Promethearchaeota archaeon]|nr:MAG: NAD(P)/FAD-dependent oxidoreductase [Candidatus Lokiarchaeota archaeon]